MPLHIVRDDIANMRVDAVVVPANSSLLIDGGAGAAVARIAGMERMQQACCAIGGCAVGKAVVTPAFDFPAKVVVHAVGPVWQGGFAGEADALYSCVKASLAAATSAGAKSIAMPLLATGAFGYPAGPAIHLETRAIQEFLQNSEADVWLVLYDRESMRAGRSLFNSIAEYIDDVYVGQHGFASTALLDDGHTLRSEGFSMRATQRARPDVLPAEMPLERDSSPEFSSQPKAKGFFKERRRRRGEKRIKEAREAWLDESRGKTSEKSSAAAPDSAVLPDASWDAMAMPAAAPVAAPAPHASVPFGEAVYADASQNLAERLAHLDESFAQTVLRLIDERGMTDVEVYKRANMSRQLFAKIRKDNGYRPTKKTACALVFALGLNHADAVALLARAGFALSHSSKFDVIVEYFLVNNIHDIFQVNEALFAYDQPILG